MAITKIWKFKSRLNQLIEYAINGEKTEEKLYVSGINCIPDTAFYEMKNVKKQFFKTEGIECFHAIQSFVKDEVTPEQAHEIGVKLANELWGEKFQVIVSTHLNTDNIHNHFVINSVSFIDGKRFCNTKRDYALMRKTSDRLCKEYGLSVLKQEEKYNKYATSNLYKELMRDSIDYAIASSKDYDEFIQILKDLDYIITDRNNSLSIRREPYKRNTKIEKQFGKNYSKENIFKRILETQATFPYYPNPYLLINRAYKSYNNIKEKHNPQKGSILYLMFHYEKLFGIKTKNALKSNVTRITPELIREIKKMDEYSNQAKLLATNNINTEEDLLKFEKSIYEKINPLKSERENLWKKHKKAKTNDEKKDIENQIIDISKKISPLSEQKKCCNNITNRLNKIKNFEFKNSLEIEHFEKETKYMNKEKYHKNI